MRACVCVRSSVNSYAVCDAHQRGIVEEVVTALRHSRVGSNVGSAPPPAAARGKGPHIVLRCAPVYLSVCLSLSLFVSVSLSPHPPPAALRLRGGTAFADALRFEEEGEEVREISVVDRHSSTRLTPRDFNQFLIQRVLCWSRGLQPACRCTSISPGSASSPLPCPSQIDRS